MTQREEVDKVKSERVSRLAQLIMTLGPDINRIALLMGLYRESARYLYKRKILGKSMVIQGVPDELALGMKRIMVKARIDPELRQYAHQLFTAMNDLCYVVAFELALPNDFYVLHASVPVPFVQSYRRFISRLAEIGVFRSAEVYDFEWYRRVPMHSELYDFNNGRWDFDWHDPIRIDRPESLEFKTRKRAKFDRTDLLILKELQIDASRSLLEINGVLTEKRQSALSYKTLHWHFAHHVVGGGLLDSYSIRWLGTGYDEQSSRAKHRNHAYLVMNLLIRDVSQRETLAIRGRMHQIPFLWCEMGGSNYLAQCAFPVGQTVEALEFLRTTISDYTERASYYVVDQKNALQFVIPYKLWSSVDERWEFTPESILPRFENFVLKAREESSIG